MEKWKVIEGFNGRYKISSTGRVWCNGKYADGRKYKPYIKKPSEKFGYLTVTLYSNRTESKSISIHRLVALAFIPNIENKPCVDHINGNKKDNRVENLRWVTHKENSNNPITHQRLVNSIRLIRKDPIKSQRLKKHIIEYNKSKSRTILQYDLNMNLLNKYSSLSEAAKKTGSNASGILKVCKGIYKNHNGYIWAKETN